MRALVLDDVLVPALCALLTHALSTPLFPAVGGGKSVIGSLIGGLPETQEMLDFWCATLACLLWLVCAALT